ncbi:MAG: EpsG family protein [Lachnospiraceae bacterium]|nr:EpsG family protein [Lachnospiraceae bacterium]
MTYSYWWALLWVFLAGGISLFFNFEQEETDLQGRRVLRWHWLPALLLMVPLVLLAAYRPLPFGDSGTYYGFFNVAPSSLSSLKSFVEGQEKDPGYAVLEIFFKSLISTKYELFFMFIAILQAIGLYITFRKCSTDYWFSIFLFVASADYYSWMHNGVRQFIAVTLIFAFLPLIIKKQTFLRVITLLLVILLASTFHLSALLCIPVLLMSLGKPWNWKTVVFLLGVIVIIFFIDRFTNLLGDMMEETQYSDEVEQLKTSTGTNIFRVIFYSIPTVASFFFRRRIAAAENKTINVCVNLSIASMGFYIISYFTSGLLIGRLPIYFSLANYILIPWMIDEFFERRSAKVLKVGFILMYSAFFYYQVGMTWGLL